MLFRILGAIRPRFKSRKQIQVSNEWQEALHSRACWHPGSINQRKQRFWAGHYHRIKPEKLLSEAYLAGWGGRYKPEAGG